MADNTPKKQRGRPWKPGQSGNPAGCKSGSRHKSTLAALALLDGEAEALTRKCVEMALEGDSVALRLCLERLVPTAKERPVCVDLPTVAGAAELPAVTAGILAAVASGELTPGEGQALAGIVEKHRQAMELSELEQRITRLEKKANGKT